MKSKLKLLFFCSLGGSFLVLFTFIWMSNIFLTDYEAKVMKWIEAISLAKPYKNLPNQDEVLFIDVSKARTVFSKDSLDTDREIIVDRKWLSEFFEFINKNQIPIKYIFCDISFEDKTKDDDNFLSSIKPFKNKFLTVDVEKDSVGKVKKNLYNLNSGTASFGIYEDIIYKIPLFGKYNDTIIPLKMYSDIEKVKFKKYWFFTKFVDQGIAFNNQIPNLYINRYQLDYQYTALSLGNIIAMLKEKDNSKWLMDFIKNKIIIIGDFENDVHNTYLQEQPGSLTLFNSYWNFKSKNHIISIYYILLLQIFFTILLWLKFIKKEIKFKNKFLWFEKIPFNTFFISFILVVFTLFSNFFLSIKISIFHLLLLFSLYEMFIIIKKFFYKTKIQNL